MVEAPAAVEAVKIDLLNEALELAQEGVAVFPCNADKTPRIAGGFHSASDDPNVVTHMSWDGAALIGAAIPEGTIVVDVDPRNGGVETVVALHEQGLVLPKTTRLVRTRSAGEHIYLRVPEGVSLRSQLGPGVDIKRPGKGYVIVPPSPGYTLAADWPVKDAPPWLLEELTVEERSRDGGAPGEARYFPFEDGTPYGLSAMERELGRLATAAEGGRNNALNAAAFALSQLAAGGELDEDAARANLEEVAFRIGLEAFEARATIESGWKAGEAEPRQAPPKVEGETFSVSTRDADHPNPTIVPDAEAEERFWVDWDVDEEPPPFYLWPLIPEEALILVFGSSEASKSMVTMALLCEGSHRGLRSSFYSFENPPATDRDRLRRWKPDPANFRLTKQPFDANDPRQLTALAKREKEWGTNVIVLDTYSHAFNSKSDDGNAKAIEFYRRMRWVMAEVGCSIIVLDHTGFEGDEPRDASAKRQQVDVAILMRSVGKWVFGEPSRFSMENRKAARFANPFFMQGAIRDIKRGEAKGLELDWTGEKPRWDVGG